MTEITLPKLIIRAPSLFAAKAQVEVEFDVETRDLDLLRISNELIWCCANCSEKFYIWQDVSWDIEYEYFINFERKSIFLFKSEKDAFQFKLKFGK